jgi:cell wall assembly regulator SMI1
VLVAEALERVLRLHDGVGSPLRRYLGPPIREADVRERLAPLDIAPPAQLIELWGIHDGVDETAWDRERAGVWYPDLVRGGPRFLGSAAAVERCRELRESAAEIAGQPWWDLAAGDLWRPGWLPVFPLMRSDENVALDCAPDSPHFGSVWAVIWEAADDRLVADSIAELLHKVADRFEAVHTRWDAAELRLDDDEKRAEELGRFP